MKGLRTKALSIGLGGIAAAFLGGQASAGICPVSTSVMTVTGAGFSCTLGDSTFSGFTISGVQSTAQVEFADISPTSDAVTLSRDGGTFPPGTVQFDYTVTEVGSHVIEEATVGIDVATLVPVVFTDTSFNGLATTPAVLSNSESGKLIFSPGVSAVDTKNDTPVLTGTFVSSITNTFAETPETVVPEPMSLSLFGLGLLGLGLARRRRS